MSMGIATQVKGSFRPWSDFYDTGTAALLLNRELLPVSRRACRILFAQNCDAVPKPNRPRPVAIADSGSPPLRCIAHRCCRPRLRTPQAGAVLLAKVSIGGGRKADRVEQPLAERREVHEPRRYDEGSDIGSHVDSPRRQPAPK
jgi:hypothetical protein